MERENCLQNKNFHQVADRMSLCWGGKCKQICCTNNEAELVENSHPSLLMRGATHVGRLLNYFILPSPLVGEGRIC